MTRDLRALFLPAVLDTLVVRSSGIEARIADLLAEELGSHLPPRGSIERDGDGFSVPIEMLNLPACAVLVLLAWDRSKASGHPMTQLVKVGEQMEALAAVMDRQRERRHAEHLLGSTAFETVAGDLDGGSA